jgi:hypothetical protein
VSLRTIDNEFKLIIDADKLDGAADSVELLLKHLNYFKVARLPDQANEFISMLTSFDDFWMEVGAQSLLIRTSRPIACGVMVVKDDNGLRSVGRSGQCCSYTC